MFAVSFFSILCVVIFLTMLYRFMDREGLILDQRSRSALVGDFINLNKGVVYYEKSDPSRKPNVVLVHGFSTPSFIWNSTYTHLADSGHSVLRFDLYGRGLSDRPNTAYDMNLYVEQLKELLDQLAVDKPVTLIGVAMGGTITTMFANRYPERVKKLTLIAPLIVLPSKPDLQVFRIPLIGEYLSKVILVKKLRQGLTDLVYDASLYPLWNAKFDIQTNYQGYARAMLSTIRNLANKDFKAEFSNLKTLNKPIQLIWGRNDALIPIEDSQLILDVVADNEFHIINNAGHLPHFEQPAEVNPKILSFLDL